MIPLECAKSFPLYLDTARTNTMSTIRITNFFFYIANVSQPKLMSKSRFPNEIKLCAIGSLFFSYRVCVLLFLNHFIVILLLYRLNINIFSLSTMSVNDETYWYLCVYFHFQLWNLVIIEQFENTNTAANTPHTCTRFCSITA